MSVDRLLDPSSIAVVGASSDDRKIGYAAMENASLFDGPVYPVNPNAAELFGQRCYDSVTEIDERVDLALLCVPRGLLPEIVRQCGRADVGGAVVYAAGFSEASPEGATLEADVVSAADGYDLTLLGPNTSGFLNTDRGVYASFVSKVEEIPTGPVSIVAQSGGINHVLTFLAGNERVGVRKAIGLGNAAATGFESIIRHLEDDAGTEAIVLHVEGFDDGRAVLETCRSIETPVAMYKVGQEDVSAFAASHTGAMIGDYELYQAACAQYGVPLVDSCQALIDAGEVLATSPEPRGTNVALVTGQAGPGIAITDRLRAAGARLPELPAATRETVESCLPGITYTANPIDTGQPPDVDSYESILTAVAESETVDVLLVYQLYEERIDYPVETMQRLRAETGVPIVFGTNGPSDDVDAGIDRFRAGGIPVFRSPERAADAVGVLVEYARTNAPTPGRSSAGDFE
ncbi:MAG: CoA-binding protein [Halobacteriota archaeon]